MAVANELARLRMSRGKAEANEYVIQTTLELRKQVFAGYTLLTDGLLEVRAELVFEDAVNTFYLLFFAQLQPIADNLRFAIAAVLPGREISFFDSARRLETALAL